MPFDQFLNLTATILGAIGTIYVLKSILRLTPALTERLTATVFGHNIHSLESLSAQKADSVVGASLVVIALVLAVVNGALAPSSTTVGSSRTFAIVLALLGAAAPYLALLAAGKRIQARHRDATAVLIAQRHLDEDVFKRDPVPAWEIPSLRFFAFDLLHMRRIDNESPEDLLGRVANRVGRTMPIGIRFEEEQPPNA